VPVFTGAVELQLKWFERSCVCDGGHVGKYRAVVA
jgi:hypothetical protein